MSSIILNTLFFISGISTVEEEEEVIDDKCYRRMDDEEEAMYVSVPLRVV